MMHKNAIGIALCGLFSTAALAQNNVTLYGIVDANYSYSKSGDRKFSGVNDGSETGMSGGRIGFKGEEALGNSLKAIFTAEFGFNATKFDSKSTSAGGGAFTNVRQSFVGLNHDVAGALTLGRQYAPSYSLLRKTAASGMQEVHATWGTIPEFTFMNVGSGARVNNSIVYQSPNWKGVELRAIYGFGEKIGATADTSDGGRYGIGLSYDNGPLFLTAIYQEIMPDGSILNDDGNASWAVGGAYDFKFIKLFANYIDENNKLASSAKKAQDIDKRMWSTGIAIPVGNAGRVIAEYANYKYSNNILSVDEGKTDGYSLGYRHSLSKRTTAYTSISTFRNDGVNNVGFNGIGTASVNNTNFSIGMRHTF